MSFAPDFFDASINRIAPRVIESRAALNAIFLALLEPTEMLQKLEHGGDVTSTAAEVGAGRRQPRL